MSSCVEFLLAFFVRELVVMVVCGAGCGWDERTRAQVHQDIGKLRHIGDCRKALDKTSQTITFT